MLLFSLIYWNVHNMHYARFITKNVNPFFFFTIGNVYTIEIPLNTKIG